MSKHTLGPFGLHIGGDYVHILASPDAHSDDAVAAVYGETKEQQIAHAHLFKAAPALLEALEELTMALFNGEKVPPAKALAAIAAAEVTS